MQLLGKEAPLTYKYLDQVTNEKPIELDIRLL